MILKLSSLIAFGVALIGLFFLIYHQYIFSYNPVVIIIQVCSFGLMIWARITFGAISFHATANTTKGKLVTNGPYKYFRHPIYAAVIYFFSASLIAFPSKEVFVAVFLIIAGLFVRLLLEEKSLNETYEGYASYSKRTKRLIPFLF